MHAFSRVHLRRSCSKWHSHYDITISDGTFHFQSLRSCVNDEPLLCQLGGQMFSRGWKISRQHVWEARIEKLSLDVCRCWRSKKSFASPSFPMEEHWEGLKSLLICQQQNKKFEASNASRLSLSSRWPSLLWSAKSEATKKLLPDSEWCCEGFNWCFLSLSLPFSPFSYNCQPFRLKWALGFRKSH